MATSTNYGWSEPDNTSLVKDGAQAIRTLGNAIDTSLWNSGYGQAGKNKCLNGAMQIAQRGTITIGASGYSLDRYKYAVATAVPTGTISQQTFTPGTAPVAGYEGSNFARINITANAGCTILQFGNIIEDVRTFAGQTATFSFYAKADASATLSTISFVQSFGSGGSGDVTTSITLNSTALTTAWTRYTGTVSVPSISGKTIGTGSYVNVIVAQPISGGVVRNGTYDYWGWQLEYGSLATPFQTASGGSIQNELAMCQRYLPALNIGTKVFGVASSTTQSYVYPTFPVTARTAPTGITIVALANYSLTSAGLVNGTPTAITFSTASVDGAQIGVTTTVGTPTIALGQGDWLTLVSGTILFTGCEL